MKTKIEIKMGDITDMEVDAIINSANDSLILGGGVAGAIRRKGGSAIQEECNKIGMISVGEAVATTAGSLKARYVIHAAAMSLGTWATAGSIRKATRSALKVAERLGLKSIAFPAIGTGIGAFSVDKCAEIMLDEVIRYIKGGSSLETIYFVLLDKKSFSIFEEIFNAIGYKFEESS
jgi:O-acetyl-ADP-ribose deacetylase (regulator of RNase III)